MNGHPTHNRRQAGFSLVEILFVLVITTVGFLALINLQVGTLHGVNNAQSMMHAVNLAEHFMETLKSEALAWNTDATILGEQPGRFPHLQNAGEPTVNGGSGWLQAYESSDADPRVGPLGNANESWEQGIANEILPQLNRRYCVHYRLTWLIPNYLMRADIRVAWLKDEANINLYQSCDPGNEMHTDLANVSSVTLPGTIMRNVFAQ